MGGYEEETPVVALITGDSLGLAVYRGIGGAVPWTLLMVTNQGGGTIPVPLTDQEAVRLAAGLTRSVDLRDDDGTP